MTGTTDAFDLTDAKAAIRRLEQRVAELERAVIQARATPMPGGWFDRWKAQYLDGLKRPPLVR